MKRGLFIKTRISEDEKTRIDRLWKGENISEEVRKFLLGGPKNSSGSPVKDTSSKYEYADLTPEESGML